MFSTPVTNFNRTQHQLRFFQTPNSTAILCCELFRNRNNININAEPQIYVQKSFNQVSTIRPTTL